MVEQRVMAGGARKPSIGAKSGGSTPAEEPSAPKKKSRKGLVIVVILALVAAAGGGAYWFAKQQSDPAVIAQKAAAAEEAAKPKPGELVQVEAKSLNLAGGHYLRLGMAVQFDAKASEGGEEGGELSTAAVSAEANKLFSNKTIGQVSDPNVREGLRLQLIDLANKHYDGHIMDVYLTDFVTQ